MHGMYVFLHEPKVSALYSETCSRVEQQIIKKKDKSTAGKVNGSLNLGGLLKFFSLDPNIGAEVSDEEAKSIEVIEKLDSSQKIKIVIASLQKEGNLINLNQFSKENIHDTIGSYITIQGTCKVNGPFKKGGYQLFEVFGQSNLYHFHFIAPLKQMVGGQVIFSWNEIPGGVPFDIFGINLGTKGEGSNTLEIDPIAIWYSQKERFYALYFNH